MTDWMNAADMTPEEFKKCLDEMTDRVHNFHKHESKRPSRSDRSYLTTARLGLSNHIRRANQRVPTRNQRLT
jgi:hypothetical protein